jgi:hypothetical protein
MNNKLKCECCGYEAQAKLEVFGDKPYLLCMNCNSELNDLNLSKKHFKNLLKNGHKDDEFLLSKWME